MGGLKCRPLALILDFRQGGFVLLFNLVVALGAVGVTIKGGLAALGGKRCWGIIAVRYPLEGSH